ncbi:MAG: DUF1611 domain-containing protein [Pseudomonadota bacterium]|nr:DUF1611 domain-containing protein [Pseudomonadota bacterium]
MTNYFYASLARISDLSRKPFDCQLLPREAWASGDYVVAEAAPAVSRGCRRQLELESGRMIEVFSGDRFIGALGRRAATLEGAGDWEHTGEDMLFHAMTSAGLMGKMSSTSPLIAHPMPAYYRGHVMRKGERVIMADFVPEAKPRALEVPVVMLVGTSMSAGKTTTGRIVVHELKQRGLRVAAAKLTGAGRYRDIQSFGDAGADHILDFVDAGLPSTVCPPEKFRVALQNLISRIAALDVDVLVAEAGASPLEPYNGDIACEAVFNKVRCMILSASDPYAVVGVCQAFKMQPDLVTGPAANTSSGAALVKKLTGITAINPTDRRERPVLERLLEEKLGLLRVENA